MGSIETANLACRGVRSWLAAATAPEKKEVLMTEVCVRSNETITLRPRHQVGAPPHQRLLEANPELFGTLKRCATTEEARHEVYAFLERTERWTFGLGCDLHPMELSPVRECLAVMRNLISPRSEQQTDASVLQSL